jgi:lipoprotein-anchoring transpeptidase ErfK/SrfK
MWGRGSVVPKTPQRPYTRMVGVAVAALSLLLTTACAAGADAAWHAAGTSAVPSGEAGGAPVKKQAPGAFKVTPAADTTEVSVLEPITVTADQSTINSVTVTNPQGKQLKGELSADKLSWKSSDQLGYAKEYTVAVDGLNSAGEPLQSSTRFTTIKPREQTMPYLRANDMHLLKERQTYGVGQTVQVYFDEKVDKATVQKLLNVTTNPSVEGAWHWWSAQKAEWRTEKYLAPGTTVSVKADLYGKDLGSGTYAQADISGSFKVGESHVMTADNNTHMMKVFVGGQLARTIPVSLGKGGTETLADGSKVNFWTNSGAHVVLDKTPQTRMTSSSFGIKDKSDPNFYDEVIKQTVRISFSGEYLHLADWHNSFGKANVSHGCINLPPGQAQWIYDLSVPGDVVEVTGTPVKLGGQNGIGSWGLSWADWKSGSAL